MKITKQADKWRLDGYVNGERIRKLFSTRARAESIAKQLDLDAFHAKHGIKALNDQQQAVAIRVFNMLKPDDDLFEIVNEYLSRKKASNKTELANAIDLFEKDLRKRNKRERYIESMTKTLNKFSRFFGSAERLVSDFSKQNIENFLDKAIKQTPVNRYNHVRDLSVFFNWCLDEKMVAENPLADIKRPHVDRKEVTVLTIYQAKAMLTNTEGADRAYASIGMFSGIRPEEIEKMDWSMVDLKHRSIRIPGSITKTRIGRTIELEPNAVEWIKTVAQDAGPVFSGDKSCLTRRLKIAAGMETWLQDILRHSYASMHVCHFKDASKTALYLHDRRAADVLFRFYFRDQLVADAKEFWSFKP
jgi:integrase/recombinase XerD